MVQAQSYKYFADLFGQENNKILYKELSKTIKQQKSSKLPPTMGSMEFKLAVIQKAQLRKDIKLGKVGLKEKRKTEHKNLPPLVVTEDTNITEFLVPQTQNQLLAPAEPLLSPQIRHSSPLPTDPIQHIDIDSKIGLITPAVNNSKYTIALVSEYEYKGKQE
jgi:hypothetical protein